MPRITAETRLIHNILTQLLCGRPIGRSTRLNHPSLCLSVCLKSELANAHETRDSISLISYAGCLGLSPVISAKVHSLTVHRS